MFKNKFATYNMVEPPEIDSNFFNNNQTSQVSSNDYFQKYFVNMNNITSSFDPLKNENLKEDTVIEETTNDQKERAIKIKENQYKATTNNKQQFTDKKEFVQTLNNAFKRALNKAGLNPSYSTMLVAQDAIETGWGAKVKGKFNFGNITTNGSDYTVKTGNLKWKDFKSIDDYAEYKIKFLSNNRYKFFNLPNLNNVQQSMQILADRGYCPGTPNYGKLVNDTYKSVLKYI